MKIISLEEQEKQKLAVEQVEREGAVKQLQGKEQELKQELAKKQAAAQKPGRHHEHQAG